MIRSLQLLVLFLTTSLSFINLKPVLRKTYLCNSYLYDINTNSSNLFNNNITPPLLAKPIPKITFDDVFLNLFSINEVFLSSNCDRIIIDYNNKKGVYYIMNKKDRERITYLLSLINIKTNIVDDYITKMDDKAGSLYCSPNKCLTSNITKYELENIINSIVHHNEMSEDSKDNNDDDDNDDDDYGYGYDYDDII
jgi:hypothetical protein